MKKYLPFSLVFLACVYLGCSFVVWDFNPAHWEVYLRIIAAVATLLLVWAIIKSDLMETEVPETANLNPPLTELQAITVHDWIASHEGEQVTSWTKLAMDFYSDFAPKPQANF